MKTLTDVSLKLTQATMNIGRWNADAPYINSYVGSLNDTNTALMEAAGQGKEQNLGTIFTRISTAASGLAGLPPGSSTRFRNRAVRNLNTALVQLSTIMELKR
jgi:hypothetical protein